MNNFTTKFLKSINFRHDSFSIFPSGNNKPLASVLSLEPFAETIFWFDEACQLWRVKTVSANGAEVEYICQWLVVATSKNAERVVPKIDGLKEFGGEVIHACEYKSGEKFKRMRVLVVGCGNSGMEVSLDLCNHDAQPSNGLS